MSKENIEREEVFAGTWVKGFLPVSNVIVHQRLKRNKQYRLTLSPFTIQRGRLSLSTLSSNDIEVLPRKRLALVNASIWNVNNQWVDRMIVHVQCDTSEELVFRVFDVRREGKKIIRSNVGFASMKRPEEFEQESYIRNAIATDSMVIVSTYYGGLHALPLHPSRGDAPETDWLDLYHMDEIETYFATLPISEESLEEPPENDLTEYMGEDPDSDLDEQEPTLATSQQEGETSALPETSDPPEEEATTATSETSDPPEEEATSETHENLEREEQEKTSETHEDEEDNPPKDKPKTEEEFQDRARACLQAASEELVELLDPLRWTCSTLASTAQDVSSETLALIDPSLVPPENALVRLTTVYVGVENALERKSPVMMILLLAESGPHRACAIHRCITMPSPVVRITVLPSMQLFVCSRHVLVYLYENGVPLSPWVMEKPGITDALFVFMDGGKPYFLVLDANHRLAFWPASNEPDRNQVVFLQPAHALLDPLILDTNHLSQIMFFPQHVLYVENHGKVVHVSNPLGTWSEFISASPSSEDYWKQEEKDVEEIHALVDKTIEEKKKKFLPASSMAEGSKKLEYEEPDRQRLIFFESGEGIRERMWVERNLLFDGYGVRVVDPLEIVPYELPEEERGPRVKTFMVGQQMVQLEGPPPSPTGLDLMVEFDQRRFSIRVPDLDGTNGGPDWVSAISIPKTGSPGMKWNAVQIERRFNEFLEDFTTPEFRAEYETRFHIDADLFLSKQYGVEQRRPRWPFFFFITTFFTHAPFFVFDPSRGQVAIFEPLQPGEGMLNALSIHGSGSKLDHFVICEVNELE